MRFISLAVACAVLAISCFTSNVAAEHFNHRLFPTNRDRIVPLGDDTMTNRSAVNVIFNRLLLALMTKDLNAASDLLTDDVESIITAVSCEPTSTKSAVLEVMTLLVDSVDVLGLQSLYHIVSEDKGAFVVEDMGSGARSNFFAPKVFFLVSLNSNRTQIQAIYEFFPTEQTADDDKRVGVIRSLIDAIQVGDVNFASKYFTDDSFVDSYPEGQEYPEQHLNSTQLIEQFKYGASIQLNNRFYPGAMYSTCNWVAFELSQTVTYGIPNKTNPSAVQVSAVKALAVAYVNLTGTAMGTPAVTKWVRFYWNQVNVVPVTQCTNAMDCSGHAVSVAGNVYTGCECSCRNMWEGSDCGYCNDRFNATKDCGACASGRIDYPLCKSA